MGSETLPPTHQHLHLPEIPPELLQYKDWLESRIKPAWLLNALEDQPIKKGDSFLGGNTPYRAVDQIWPSCPHCQREMGFVMQVVLNKDIASSVPGLKSGTFQFWNCWVCIPSGEPATDARQLWTFEDRYVQYGPSRHLARWFEGQTAGFGSEYKSEQNLGFIKLLQPEPFLSLPVWDDESLPAFSSKESDIYSDTFAENHNRNTISQIGGYASWKQGAYTPHNPSTGQESTFFLALGTGDTDVLWGDTGFYYFFAENGNLHEPFVLEQTL